MLDGETRGAPGMNATCQRPDRMDPMVISCLAMRAAVASFGQAQ